MTGEGIGTGVAAGLATGLAIAAIEKEEAEGKARRKSHMGTDQVMLESRKCIDPIGEKIAEIYSNWYYNKEDGQIYRRERKMFGFFGAGLGASAIAICLIAYAIIVEVAICTDWRNDSCNAAWFPLDFFPSALLCIGIGILVGFVLHPEDVPIDYIRLSESQKGTRILLKVYDDKGRRNLDEDTISDIKEML